MVCHSAQLFRHNWIQCDRLWLDLLGRADCRHALSHFGWGARRSFFFSAEGTGDPPSAWGGDHARSRRRHGSRLQALLDQLPVFRLHARLLPLAGTGKHDRHAQYAESRTPISRSKGSGGHWVDHCRCRFVGIWVGHKDRDVSLGCLRIVCSRRICFFPA